MSGWRGFPGRCRVVLSATAFAAVALACPNVSCQIGDAALAAPAAANEYFHALQNEDWKAVFGHYSPFFSDSYVPDNCSCRPLDRDLAKAISGGDVERFTELRGQQGARTGRLLRWKRQPGRWMAGKRVGGTGAGTVFELEYTVEYEQLSREELLVLLRPFGGKFRIVYQQPGLETPTPQVAEKLSAASEVLARECPSRSAEDAGVTPDLGALREACEKSPPEACPELYVALAKRGEPAAAASLLRKYCDQRQEWACSGYGLVLVGKGEAVEGERLLTRGCDGGNLEACANLGAVLMSKGDGSGATKVLGKSCSGGHPLGCSNLGVLFQKSGGDHAAVEDLFRRACNGKSANGSADYNLLGCFNLASLSFKDRPEDAEPLLRRACGGGLAIGCSSLGALLLTRGEQEQAKGFLCESCRAGDVAGCSNLASLLEQLGQPADARAVYQLACRGGDQKACAQVRTPGVARNWDGGGM
jgi:uncharacterized protein